MGHYVAGRGTLVPPRQPSLRVELSASRTLLPAPAPGPAVHLESNCLAATPEPGQGGPVPGNPPRESCGLKNPPPKAQPAPGNAQAQGTVAG
jgi:hypothetical protein